MFKMKSFAVILLTCAFVRVTRANCWWTGCQPFTWAQRGCGVYDMDEIKVTDCDEGNKFYCCDKKSPKSSSSSSSSSSSAKRECWWTGCQPHSWAEKGCSVYNMDEVATEECDGGDKYRCCSKVKQTSSSSSSSSSRSSLPKSDSSSASKKKRECWWTGCQPTSWAERGCGVYNMVTIAEQSCEGGDKYHCCEKLKEETESGKAAECWWTGCQPTTWAERGCEVYDMDQVATTSCDGGDKYKCCTRKQSSSKKKQQSTTVATIKPDKCWWTGCQPSFLKKRGCEIFGLDEIEQLVCNNGHQFHCCEKSKIKESSSSSKSEECWWTGCQPFSWAQRGCEVYDMKEVGRDECEDGTKFHCCGQASSDKPKSIKKEVTTEKPKASSHRECWWTGCQLNSWAERGCTVYKMDEVETESCHGGLKYHCCSKGSSSDTRVSTNTRATSPPRENKRTIEPSEESCHWTGCQPDSWTERGCLEAGEIQIESKHCIDGKRFHCCSGGGSEASHRSVTRIPLTTKRPQTFSESDKLIKQSECWWTGCQPSSWYRRGCGIYSMIEINRQTCENGIKFHCCKPGEQTHRQSVSLRREDKLQSTRIKPPTMSRTQQSPKAHRECWWTGCQPFDWAERGCAVYKMDQVNIEPCRHGEKFYCCEKV
ncbi:uncharacterized protein B4U79_14869 [Dinothrombium tinctorium]|uniref:Uncharacterized protein n=1 Tax=Dinothrombium tinctorium TaxID=1965070 RepID=A0A3S3RV92_9ACAR|nr:uncharacterized protein B4U79_07697 [Dinothrombium tinctorium]RWS05232.1 uncharacterized protein B4U79_14869 [Dinothrombium tinctorium]